MTFPSVLSQLTQLYTKKVQRMLDYQELSTRLTGSGKTKGFIRQLVEEEREQLQILSTVITVMLSGEENEPAAKNEQESAAPEVALSSQIPAQQEAVPKPAHTSVAEKTEVPAATEPLAPPTENEETTTPNDEQNKNDFSVTKKKIPLVWNFGRTPKD